MGGQGADVLWKIAQRRRAGWPPTSFLAGLELPVLRDFLSAGELAAFGKGDTIIGEGDAAIDVFLLLDACVKVTARLDAGGRALLAVRVGGDVVGEIAAMAGGARTATVSACGNGEAVAIRLGRDDLREVLGRHPDAAVSLASAISRKLRAATRRRVDISGCTTKVGMARVLLEIAEDHGSSGGNGVFIGVSLTQSELGTLVGVSETTAQRALSELRNDGVIASEGRRLLVPNMAVLRFAAWGTQPEGVI